MSSVVEPKCFPKLKPSSVCALTQPYCDGTKSGTRFAGTLQWLCYFWNGDVMFLESQGVSLFNVYEDELDRGQTEVLQQWTVLEK